MELALCIFTAVIFVVYLFSFARTAAQPRFAVKGILTGEKLGYMISALAFSSKRTRRGGGIGLKGIRSRLYEARRRIHKIIESEQSIEDCERAVYDNFSLIDRTLCGLGKESRSFAALPHVDGAPRLYLFCELLVKSLGGLVSAQNLKDGVRAYCNETPFLFNEILSLKSMLEFALCEYLALYAEKAVKLRDIQPENYLSVVSCYNAHICATIRSLGALDAIFTEKYVNRLSPVYYALERGDGTFCKLTEETKRLYLGRIFRIAKRDKTSETNIASEILYRAQKDGRDIAHYILPRPKGKGWQRAYAVASVLLAVAIGLTIAFILPSFGWLYAVLGLPIEVFVADFILRLITRRVLWRRYLPAYDAQKLDSSKYRTTVLMPCFAASEADIEDAFIHLETVAAANPEELFSYALLFDFKKSDTEIAESDAGMCGKIQEMYASLSDKIGSRTSVIVRRRKRVQGEKYFQGYEKKRGALLDYNRYVLTGENDFYFSVGELPKPKYIITLDSDTLTCECANLVGVKAHPYSSDAAVISVNCKANCKKTVYAKLYAGETGPGRYRCSRDSASHDLFGLGNYTGKGIYDVKMFSERLDGFFPDNAILSHDFIEGAVAGCLDSSVNASEDFPSSFENGFTRDLRWLRGDWQLLPYVRKKVKDRDGKVRKSPLSPIAVYVICHNLILSLVPIAQMAVLIASLIIFPHVSVLIPIVLPQLLRFVYVAIGAFCGRVKTFAAETARCITELLLLPTVAFYKLSAVSVTLVRLVTKKRLLEWSVFSHTKGNISVLPNIITSALILIVTPVFSLNAVFYCVGALFAAGAVAPSVLASQRSEQEPSDKMLARVTDTAKRTFEYFSRQENLYRLPCDCYQADNAKGWCARTSPTNIGMALVAYASAYELDIIDYTRFICYAERIVSAVEECEKYHGHLYNWYDCKSLAVLPRRFVSTVDSGNFCTALSLVYAYADGALKKRILALIEATDFGVLFDDERKLLYIGYDDELKTNTHNHYDLLGSESTLTYLFACGHGKIPKEAFYNLDRKGVRYKNGITVYAWTGGMFEYLMARLFVSPGETLYGEAMRGAVRAQIDYAAECNSSLWGISECRYAALDDCGGNLYRAFGVPHIAHGTVPENPPYAPYASFLALPYCDEKEFLSNLDTFEMFGAYSDMGFCDSVDGRVAVRSFMTHHQGMILAACANAVKRDCIARKLETLPEWRAAKLMCGEEPITHARRKKRFVTARKSAPVVDTGVYLSKCANLSAVVAQNFTEINHGMETLLRKLSVTADCEELLCGDFSAYTSGVWRKSGEGFSCSAELCVLPTPLAVAVSVSYRNVSERERKVRFRTAAEPLLARKEDYEAHPAYSRMFIETGKGASDNYVWARRRNGGVTVIHHVCAPSDIYYSGDMCAYYSRGRGTRFGQNVNPLLWSEFEAELKVGEEFNFTCWFSIADTEERADYAVRLASVPDCVTRFKGYAETYAKSVSARTRTIAAKLMRHEYPALAVPGIGLDRPTVAYETGGVNTGDIAELLADIKLLYEVGFSFNTVLFAKKKKGDYPCAYFDTDKEIERSGIRGVGGRGSITAYNCESDDSYRILSAEPYNERIERVMWQDGKSVPYKESKRAITTFESDEEFPYKIVTALGMGGFTEDCGYAIDLSEEDTPAPWCNIMADGEFGTVITESGGGFTFGNNSRQDKLTVWSNDPVRDEVSELVALCEGGTVWSITKRPLTVKAKYFVKHAQGYSEFVCVYNGIKAILTEFIERESCRKIYLLNVRNLTDEHKDLCALFGIDAVLGDFTANTRASISYEVTDEGLKIYCGATRNVAYIYSDSDSSEVGVDVTDGEASIYDTASVRFKYSGLAVNASVDGGDSVTIKFALSSVPPESLEGVESEVEKACGFYDRLPKITFDGEFGYLTKWLAYQVYNSRFAGRTGFYQVSGAYGFRDQLQDSLAVLYCEPSAVREHILECAAHQFKEGDVQHWWHKPAIGVRTHICDDKLWLVYAVCEYVAFTSDKSILEEYVPFLEDVAISPSDVSVYRDTHSSQNTASVYEHCLRAIYSACDFGENGLVRMRGGDWNDAMDKVGEAGEGTSVWCSMFLYFVIERFLAFVKDVDLCDKLRNVNKKIYDSVTAAYESDRFLRAYRDDGTPLGSEECDACKIDVLTQSWSVIAGIGNVTQKSMALHSAYAHLCDAQHKIIKLFDPPFGSPDKIGYIGNYPRGIRENGGQYTQAAVWYVWALYAAGDAQTAYKLLKWLSPAERCRTQEDVREYCVEPYVSAADVYAGDLIGKGGWTWYTGSASWLYRCLIEQYAGIKVRGDVVSFDPKLPNETAELNVTFRFGSEKIKVKIINSRNSGNWRVRIGDVIYNTSSLKLTKGLSGKNIAVIKLLN